MRPSRRVPRLTFPVVLAPLLLRLLVVEIVGFAYGRRRGVRDGFSLFSAFTHGVQHSLSGSGSTLCGFFRSKWGLEVSAIFLWGDWCAEHQGRRFWGLTTSSPCLWGVDKGLSLVPWPDWTSIGQLKVRTSILKANSKNVFCKCKPLCLGLPFFSRSPLRGVEIVEETTIFPWF